MKKRAPYQRITVYEADKLILTRIKLKRIMNLGLPEILLIALVVLLLFGGKKIPELMKGLGKGVKSFKDGVNGIDDEAKSIENEVNKPLNDKKNAERSMDSE